MDNKQDIGLAIKNKLENYSQAPANADGLWDNISAQLDNTSDSKKPLPFWLRAGSLALIGAVVLLSIWYVASPSDTTNSDNTVVNSPTNSQDGSTVQDSGSQNSNSTPNNNGNSATPITTIQDSNTNLKTGSASSTTNSIPSTDSDTNATNTNTGANNTAPTNNGVTTSQQGQVSSATSGSNSTNTSPNTTTTLGVTSGAATATNNKQPNTSNSTTGSTRDKSRVTTNTKTSSGQPLNSNTTRSTVNGSTNSVPNNSGTTVNTAVPARGFYVLSNNSIASQGYNTLDSKPLVMLQDQELSKATNLPVITYNSNVKSKKTKEMRRLERELRKDEVMQYKWTIGPMIAPTSYGSLTKGSMLDARLESNPREGETNLSYGIRVKNQFAKKSALRFGVNRINLGYNTQNFQVNIINDIVNVYQLTGIDPGNEIENGGVSLDPSATEFFENNNVVGLNQDISYLEFPLEYEYGVINSRFGANIIGGTSVIVLDDNRISAVSNNGESIAVGSSNNLTNFGLTLNLGLGLEYEISKRLQFNVDPIFKMQMNSSENASINNFRPYYFGIYSGLSFKF